MALWPRWLWSKVSFCAFMSEIMLIDWIEKSSGWYLFLNSLLCFQHFHENTIVANYTSWRPSHSNTMGSVVLIESPTNAQPWGSCFIVLPSCSEYNINFSFCFCMWNGACWCFFLGASSWIDGLVVEPDMSAGFCPDHKAAMVLFLDRVYGIEDQNFLLHLLEVGFLPDLRAAASLDTVSVLRGFHRICTYFNSWFLYKMFNSVSFPL